MAPAANPVHFSHIEVLRRGGSLRGRTALRGAIYLGIAKMRRAGLVWKALLIISDGGSQRSRYAQREVEAPVEKADVQIYAIDIFDFVPVPFEQRRPGLPEVLIGITGGRCVSLEKPDKLGAAGGPIGMELRNRSLLGYRPSTGIWDGRLRRLRVKRRAPMGLPLLTAYAKTGYYAPEE